MKEKAQILDTGVPLFFKAQLEINAPAQKIFDFISNPANHPFMDGSGMVKRSVRGGSRLYLGAKFGMKMKYAVPYFIKNQVIEFQEGKVIAWQHLLHNIWRYELTEIDSNTTLVTESWDGRQARSKWWISDSGEWVPTAMAKTLVKLKGLMQG
jgi:hypothetical protein